MIDLAADRGKFICQSQSLNLFVKEAKFNVITSMLFHAWKVGLKTGVYYLHTRPQSKAQSFTIAPKEEPSVNPVVVKLGEIPKEPNYITRKTYN